MKAKRNDLKHHIPTEDTTTVYSGKHFDIKKYLKHHLTE